MINKKTYKNIKSLKNRKFRYAQKRFIVEGLRLIKTILENGGFLENVLFTKAFKAKNLEFINQIDSDMLFDVSEKEMKDLSENQAIKLPFGTGYKWRKGQSNLILANVRSATLPDDVSYNNTHPFKYKNFLFSHNGFIKNFNFTHKKKILKNIDSELLSSLKGNTDSEYIFFLFLHAYQKIKNSKLN